MSLLMDALKRAEAANRDNPRPPRLRFDPPGQPPAAPDLSLEPLVPPPLPEPDPRPAVPESGTDKQAAPSLAAAPPTTNAAPPRGPAPDHAYAGSSDKRAAAETTRRDGVRNAFAVKQDASLPPSRRPLWLAAGAVGLLAVGFGFGAYVWNEFSAINRGSLAIATRHMPAAAPATPQPLVPADNPPPVAIPAPATPARVPLPPSVNEKAAAVISPPARHAATAAANIRFTRTPQASEPALLRAYGDLQRGDIEGARRDYENALRGDPNNIDALLALAAIAQRQGRAAEADALRRQAWRANPEDPAVNAALLGAQAAEIEPQSAESRLKTELSAHPESAPLNFALGNLYARQNRWTEAQQVYFDAVASDGDNPDYLFNLAVSLDHMRQVRLAAQHYRLALDAAGRRPAAFDRAAVERRLAELAGTERH